MGISLQALPHPSDGLFSGRVEIARQRFSIGRASDNDWIIADAKRMVSKHHCVIEQTSDGYRLVDRSTNGVSVNGRPVDRNIGQLLRSGDEIEIAQYRFRVDMPKSQAPGGVSQLLDDDPLKPRITAILHDVAPVGEGAAGTLKGREDAFSAALEGRAGTSRGRVAPELGWDGPPPREGDVVKPADVIEPSQREFMNRSEQLPAEQMRIDLPRPKQIIPDDWLADAPPEAATGAQTAVPDADPFQKLDTGPVNIIPVQNIQLDEPAPAPPQPVREGRVEPFAPPPAPAAPSRMPGAHWPAPDTLAQAFCDGAGLPADSVTDADMVRFFHNIGRAIAVSVTELQALQESKNKSAALLDANDGTGGRTPWIFSVSGENRAQAIRAVVEFLRDCEPRDVEMMRADFAEFRDFLEQNTAGIIAFVEHVRHALSPHELERNVAATAKALPALRKAAMWDALVDQSGLFAKRGKSAPEPDLLAVLRAELEKKRK